VRLTGRVVGLAGLMLSVLIQVQGSRLECLERAETRIKQPDGTYRDPQLGLTTLENRCWDAPYVYAEEWTDYPEQGGTFIRRLPTTSW
jgi:hypothetical protein